MAYYKDFAYVYDRLMVSDVDYDAYAQYIKDIFSRYGKQANLLCDLACGTGNMTLALKNQGFDMTGIDISEDMLNVAREKVNDPSILFLNQNIASLDLYGTMDAFTCCIDGINYIISPKSLFDMLKKIKTCFINPDGLVIFDISSRYKLQNIIGNNTFIHNNKDVFYTWQNRYIDSKNLVDMYLNFFIYDKGAYHRFEERHLQRAYTEDEIIKIAKCAGFNTVDVYDYLTFNKPTKTSQRLVFVLK